MVLAALLPRVSATVQRWNCGSSAVRAALPREAAECTRSRRARCEPYSNAWPARHQLGSSKGAFRHGDVLGRPSIRCTWRMRSPSASKALSMPSPATAIATVSSTAPIRVEPISSSIAASVRESLTRFDSTLERIEHARHSQRVRVGGDVADRIDGPAPGGLHRLVLQAPALSQEQQLHSEFGAQFGRPAEHGDALRAQPVDRRGDVDRVHHLLGCQAVCREAARFDTAADAARVAITQLRNVQVRCDTAQFEPLATEGCRAVQEGLERLLLVSEVGSGQLPQVCGHELSCRRGSFTCRFRRRGP